MSIFLRLMLSILFLLNSMSIASTSEAQITPPPSKIARTDEADTLKKAGLTAMQEKDWTLALGIWDRYIVLNASSGYGYSMRGRAFFELGQNDQAIVSYQKAIEVEPQESSSWIGLCWTLILKNKDNEARDPCAKAVEIDSTNATNLVNLGHTYLLQGDTATAYEWYQKTLLNIDQEQELKEGPIADFDLFITKGWRTKESKEAKNWFEMEGAKWLARWQPIHLLFRAANAVDEVNDSERGIVIKEQILSLLISLQGEAHPLVKDARRALIVTHDHYADALYTKGEYAQALIHYQLVLAFKEEHLGTEHQLTAVSLNDVAKSQKGLSRDKESEPLFLRALAILEKVNDPNHLLIQSILGDLIFLYEIQGRDQELESLYLRALAISEKINGTNHSDTGTILNNLAVLYKTQGRYQEAESLYLRALVISEKVNGTKNPLNGHLLNSLALLYEAMHRFQEAETLRERTLSDLAIAYGSNHPVLISNLNEVAEQYKTQGRYQAAQSLYLRVLTNSEKDNGPNHADTGSHLNNLANLYKTQGRYQEAEPLYLRALSISKKTKGHDHVDTAGIQNNLASLYETQGRYQEAKLLYVRSLAISEKINGPEHPNTGTILNNLAGLFRTLGRYQEAEPLYVRSLAISEKAEGPNHPSTGTRLNNLASLYKTQGRYQEAESLSLRALAISEKANGPNHPSTGLSLNNLAELYKTKGRYQEAESLYVRALAISETTDGPNHPSTGISLNNLAALYETQGRFFEAESLLQRSLRIFSIAGEPQLEWTIQSGFMYFHTKTHPDLAIWYGKQAVNTLQRVRAMNTGLDKDTQKSFLQKNESTYKSLADLLFARGRLAEGQQVLAMLKESEYFDFLQRSSTSDPRKTRADFTDQERPWIERYSVIEKQLASLGKEAEALREKSKKVELSAEEVKRKEQLDADLVVARQAFDAFAVELKNEFTQNQTSNRSEKDRTESYGAKNLAGLTKLQGTLRDLTQSSKAGVVSLHYLMTEHRLWILLTTPTVQLKREVAIKETDLNRQIGEYRAAIAERSPKVKELGKALYDVILAPVVDDLKQADAKTLMVSLDGSLRYLPIAALYDGKSYVAERYHLSLLTSADYQDFKEAPRSQWTFAGYGLTQKIEDFNPLPAVQSELEGMKRDMKGQVKLNNDFTSKAFKAGLEKEPPVVHVASHFVFKPGNQSDSFLLLGDGKRLSLKDINEQYQFINLDLLTLSACETAVGGGKDENGREVEGFAMLAQQKGAKSVLATLWNVNDESTGQFMQLFYGYRQKNPGMSKAQAIQKAQQAFIEGIVKPSLAQVRRAAESVDSDGKVRGVAVTSTDHPYYWAPFILMGNWR